ncbi:MAG: carbohydrate ABC transporter permease [Saccharospirillaceae bacterium]|nr:carbohydrate ABC transporter permease [Pseudomonadales bacterium]NRB78591.1 carbohydrate ABC transporter permease [Saccharospirillaceae bacterium]
MNIFDNALFQKSIYAFLKYGVLAFLILFAMTTIFPFVYSIVLSTHDQEGISSLGVSMGLGIDLVENYNELLQRTAFWTGITNSAIIAILGTVISIFFCSMCGYSLAVYKFKGRNVIFGIMLLSMMIPPVLSLIPYFLIVDMLGLMNTHFAVWVPFTIAPMGIFLVRQYVVASIPKDLLEAAKLDGAGEFRIYSTIVMPLLKPSLATLAIIQFVFLWNNFLQPLVILEGDKAVIITMIRSMQGTPDAPMGAIILGSFLSMLPLILVFVVSSKQMISGLTSGAVK